jgi:hypothetical protein
MRTISQRLTGAVLVAALHVPVILGLLYVNLAPGVRQWIAETPRETTVVLPPLPQTSTAPVKGELRNGAAVTVPSDLKLPSPLSFRPHRRPHSVCRCSPARPKTCAIFPATSARNA